MATSQLSKKDTATWMRMHGSHATLDYVQRRNGYTIRATVPKTGGAPTSIWLDHFTTESAAQTALRMLQPKTVSTAGATRGNPFDESGDQRDA